jgi:hypothetical protein
VIVGLGADLFDVDRLDEQLLSEGADRGLDGRGRPGVRLM